MSARLVKVLCRTTALAERRRASSAATAPPSDSPYSTRVRLRRTPQENAASASRYSPSSQGVALAAAVAAVVEQQGVEALARRRRRPGAGGPGCCPRCRGRTAPARSARGPGCARRAGERRPVPRGSDPRSAGRTPPALSPGSGWVRRPSAARAAAGPAPGGRPRPAGRPPATMAIRPPRRLVWSRPGSMPMAKRYWLMKSEPDVFSIDHLARAPGKTTFWDGVRNYQARNLLRDEIKLGDGVLFYHSSADPPAVAGHRQRGAGGLPRSLPVRPHLRLPRRRLAARHPALVRGRHPLGEQVRPGGSARRAPADGRASRTWCSCSAAACRCSR